MKKNFILFLFYLLIGLQFSCSPSLTDTSVLVETSIENINAITRSSDYTIDIEITEGSIGGNQTRIMQIQIKDGKACASYYTERTCKDFHPQSRDSVSKLFIELLTSHDPLKEKLGDSCMTKDENYTIYNDSIKVKILPIAQDRKLHEIQRFVY